MNGRPEPTAKASEQRVLVGIVPTRADLQLFSEQRWYRVPFEGSITRGEAWPPQWVCAFETIAAGASSQQALRYGPVTRIEIRTREELFPGVPAGSRAGKRYFQIHLGELQELPVPLTPKRPRRTPFVQTTLRKLLGATEFNDLFNDSPFENDLWDAFKSHGIDAERQWSVQAPDGNFILDFALFCRKRSLDVEVDGRMHHSIESRSIGDAARDRALATLGWGVVRFTTEEIRKRMTYCIERVSQAVQISGGIDGLGPIRREGQSVALQMSLLEERFTYDADGDEDEL